jgi:octopine/nopaline transport system substrate-binding protein
MLKRLFPIAFAAALMTAVSAHAGTRTAITIASEGASPPWDSIDANGQLIGYDIDVGKELCRRMNIECKFVAQDWDGIIPALTVGKYDAIISGMSITEKRKKTIAFSEPYAVGTNQIVMRTDSNLPPTDIKRKLDLTGMDAEKQAILDQLKGVLTGKTLGVLRSSNSEAVLTDLFGKVATIRSYDSIENMKLDLAAGRIDGGLADYSTWKLFLETKDGQGASFYGPQLFGGTWGPGIGVGIRKDDGDLVEAFNKAIASAVNDGTLKKLSVQWFGFDISPTPTP